MSTPSPKTLSQGFQGGSQRTTGHPLPPPASLKEDGNRYLLGPLQLEYPMDTSWDPDQMASRLQVKLNRIEGTFRKRGHQYSALQRDFQEVFEMDLESDDE